MTRPFLLYPLFTLTRHAFASPLSLTTRDVIIKGSGSNISALDPITFQPVPQSIPTDGGGTGGFTPPHILWLGFCAIIGLPLAAAGVRGYRFTTAIAMGLAIAVTLWAAFINSLNSTGLTPDPAKSDLILSVMVIAAFMVGSVLGYMPWGIKAGMALMGAVGGMALSSMIVMIRENLLIPIYAVNWVVIGLFVFSGPIIVLWRPKIGMVIYSAASGSFLVILALDLAINQQAGMSRGLRYLMDRNASHVIDFMIKGYKPPLKTQIILGVGILLVPLLSYAQYRFFPEPFIRTEEELEIYQDKRRRKVDNIGDISTGSTDSHGPLIRAHGGPISRFSHM